MAVVEVIPWSEAVALCSSIETKNVNFHDIFDPTGCLLACNERKVYQSGISSQPYLGRSGNRKEKRKISKSYYKTNLQFFSLLDLAASIENGCRSCKVLRSVLEHVSLICPRDEQLGTNSLYSFGGGFILRKQVNVNNVMETHEIKLFHPQGTFKTTVVSS